MAVYDFRHCMLPENPVLFTISHLVLNCGKLSYIHGYITTFPVVFELIFSTVQGDRQVGMVGCIGSNDATRRGSASSLKLVHKYFQDCLKPQEIILGVGHSISSL